MDEAPHELPERAPASLLHELDYLHLILTDVLEINSRVPAIADLLVGVPIDVLEAAVSADPQPAMERIGDRCAKAIRMLGELGEPIDRIVELLGGRAQSMRREGGISE